VLIVNEYEICTKLVSHCSLFTVNRNRHDE